MSRTATGAMTWLAPSAPSVFRVPSGTRGDRAQELLFVGACRRIYPLLNEIDPPAPGPADALWVWRLATAIRLSPSGSPTRSRDRFSLDRSGYQGQ